MATRGIPPRSFGARVLRADHSFFTRAVLLPRQALLHSESAGGVVLFVAAVVAMVWANSPWGHTYFGLWHHHIGIDLGFYKLSMPLHEWINDGLMTLFFFAIGLELKVELAHGELSSFKQAVLPSAAALGGMIAPALLFVSFNHGTAAGHGWGIPMATDIAFAVGALALLGNRVPPALRTFLLALATVDDLGAILVIALFYSTSLAVLPMAAAAVLLAFLYLMRRIGVLNPAAYLIPGMLLWVAVLESGVHATIAGVTLGLLTPTTSIFTKSNFAETASALMARFRMSLINADSSATDEALGRFEVLTVGTEAPAQRLVRSMEPWVIYLVLPIFALANAGVDLHAMHLGEAASDPVTLGVFLGLVIGKPLGIVALTWITVAISLSSLPNGVRWSHMVGIGILGGIGFTVALFMTDLSFDTAAFTAHAKIAILSASTLAGLLGYLTLRMLCGREAAEVEAHREVAQG
jgi:Na+:H+ antiporter, NhaA family